jgi:hemerythrin-like metal-binding protein
METIKWRDELSVGVAEMDMQHQKLITMINKLIEEQKTLTDPATIAEMLTAMTDYAEEHFRAEEYLMSEYGYERKDEQYKQHLEFIQNTQSYYSAADIGANILSKALLDYLRKWLVDHILKEDMKYKSFFEKKGVQ